MLFPQPQSTATHTKVPTERKYEGTFQRTHAPYLLIKGRLSFLLLISDVDYPW